MPRARSRTGIEDAGGSNAHRVVRQLMQHASIVRASTGAWKSLVPIWQSGMHTGHKNAARENHARVSLGIDNGRGDKLPASRTDKRRGCPGDDEVIYGGSRGAVRPRD